MNECKHINAIVRGSDPIGYIYCPDCGELISLEKHINKILELLKIIKGAIEDETYSIHKTEQDK